MNHIINNINALPVNTWHRLGVGGKTIELPEIKTRLFAPPESPACTITPDTGRLDGVVFHSAAGAEPLEYIAKHKNAGVTYEFQSICYSTEPVTLRYDLTEDAPALVEDNVIIAQADSSITLLITAASEDGLEGYRLGSTRIVAEENASVGIVFVNMPGGRCTSLNDVSVVVHKNAGVSVTMLELGSRRAFAACNIDLLGEGSHGEINTFYFGDQGRELDFNCIVRHIGRKTTSSITCNGALLSGASKIFRGTLDFVRGSKGSAGSESENTLLFSPDVRNRTAPLILCGEEDIEGTHSATVGRIDSAKLYYMQSRGISEDQCKRLIIEAQLDTILRNVPDEELKSEITTYMNKRITS